MKFLSWSRAPSRSNGAGMAQFSLGSPGWCFHYLQRFRRSRAQTTRPGGSGNFRAMAAQGDFSRPPPRRSPARPAQRRDPAAHGRAADDAGAGPAAATPTPLKGSLRERERAARAEGWLVWGVVPAPGRARPWGGSALGGLIRGLHPAESCVLGACQSRCSHTDGAPAETCSHPGPRLRGVPQPYMAPGW